MLTLNILGTPKRREALCPSCAYVVLQKGVDGEEITSCNYGGTLRELRITVCECTAYLDRRTINRRARSATCAARRPRSSKPR